MVIKLFLIHNISVLFTSKESLSVVTETVLRNHNVSQVSEAKVIWSGAKHMHKEMWLSTESVITHFHLVFPL